MLGTTAESLDLLLKAVVALQRAISKGTPAY